MNTINKKIQRKKKSKPRKGDGKKRERSEV